MSKKRKLQIAVDALMLLILLLQMSYSILSEFVHEINGILLFSLFVLHHILSASFTKGLFRSRKRSEKIIKICLDILLTADILMIMLSSVVVSKYLFTFLGISKMTDAARLIHMAAAYWGFVLISVHLGLHLDFILAKFKGLKRKTIYAVMTLLSALGLYFFMHEGIYKYMLLINRFVFFDKDAGLVIFLLKYLPISVMFAFIGYLLLCAVRIKKKGE